MTKLELLGLGSVNLYFYLYLRYYPVFSVPYFSRLAGVRGFQYSGYSNILIIPLLHVSTCFIQAVYVISRYCCTLSRENNNVVVLVVAVDVDIDIVGMVEEKSMNMEFKASFFHHYFYLLKQKGKHPKFYDYELRNYGVE